MRQDNHYILQLPCCLLVLHRSSFSLRIMTSRGMGVLVCVIESASDDVQELGVPYLVQQNVRFSKKTAETWTSSPIINLYVLCLTHRDAADITFFGFSVFLRHRVMLAEWVENFPRKSGISYLNTSCKKPTKPLRMQM